MFFATIGKLNGGLVTTMLCSICTQRASLVCADCEIARYCSDHCQASHCATHAPLCDPMRQNGKLIKLTEKLADEIITCGPIVSVLYSIIHHMHERSGRFIDCAITSTSTTIEYTITARMGCTSLDHPNYNVLLCHLADSKYTIKRLVPMVTCKNYYDLYASMMIHADQYIITVKQAQWALTSYRTDGSIICDIFDFFAKKDFSRWAQRLLHYLCLARIFWETSIR